MQTKCNFRYEKGCLGRGGGTDCNMQYFSLVGEKLCQATWPHFGLWGNLRAFIHYAFSVVVVVVVVGLSAVENLLDYSLLWKHNTFSSSAESTKEPGWDWVGI